MVLIYDVAYKTPYGAKPLHIIFYKEYGYIRKCDKTRFYDKTKTSIISFK